MAHSYCPGYAGAFAALVDKHPDDAVYPRANFRVEWGPVFHRGRLDGSARILVIGQDPDSEYGTANVQTAGIESYRNEWISAIVGTGTIQAVLALGDQAEDAFDAWKKTLPPGNAAPAFVKIMHPTRDKHGQTTTAQLLANWSKGLQALSPLVTPDAQRLLVPYGATFAASDLQGVPERDVPPGVPPWMRDLKAWATRPEKPGPDPQTDSEKEQARLYKRGHLMITVPSNQLV
jgi:uracil-DNA glycosylase